MKAQQSVNTVRDPAHELYLDSPVQMATTPARIVIMYQDAKK